MTAVYHQGLKFSFESEADVQALIDLLPSTPALAEKVVLFAPDGEWLIQDGNGGYRMHADGTYVVEGLSHEGLRRYRRARGAVDLDAVHRLQDERRDRAQADAEKRLPMSSRSSTGADWWDECR